MGLRARGLVTFGGFGGSGGSEGIYTRTNNTVGYYNFLITGGSLTTLGPMVSVLSTSSASTPRS